MFHSRQITTHFKETVASEPNPINSLDELQIILEHKLLVVPKYIKWWSIEIENDLYMEDARLGFEQP